MHDQLHFLRWLLLLLVDRHGVEPREQSARLTLSLAQPQSMRKRARDSTFTTTRTEGRPRGLDERKETLDKAANRVQYHASLVAKLSLQNTQL